MELEPIRPVPPIRRDMDILANRLPSSDSLDGTTIDLALDNEGTLSLAMAGAAVSWKLEADRDVAASGHDPYDAVEVRPGLFFLDFVTSDETGAFSIVVDLERSRALVVRNELGGTGANPWLRLFVHPGRIGGGSGRYEPVEETRELLGTRLYCEYSDEAALEHIYLNSKTLCWQWLVSPEVLATEVGVEAASYWKIRDRLYLLVTRGDEPSELTLLLDLEQKRNVGRLFGRTGYGLLDRRCGAKITMLGEFAYPRDRTPG
jgi:hypothetical protein